MRIMRIDRHQITAMTRLSESQRQHTASPKILLAVAVQLGISETSPIERAIAESEMLPVYLDDPRTVGEQSRAGDKRVGLLLAHQDAILELALTGVEPGVVKL